MKNCKYCGTELDDSAIFCTACGANQNASENATQNPTANTVIDADAKHTGFVVLGFFFPIIALILYLVWKDTEPAKALACGKGGLMSVSLSSPIIGLVIYLIMKDKYPEIAKACGICAIIGVVIGVFYFILMFALMFLGMAGSFASIIPLI